MNTQIDKIDTKNIDDMSFSGDDIESVNIKLSKKAPHYSFWKNLLEFFRIKTFAFITLEEEDIASAWEKVTLKSIENEPKKSAKKHESLQSCL